jgi:hypothetical protein
VQVKIDFAVLDFSVERGDGAFRHHHSDSNPLI